MRIRGHHLCCVFCYVGSGAASAREFFGVDNAIPQLVDTLRANPALPVEILCDMDDVCVICPLKRPDGCGRAADAAAQNEKLRQWDRAILERLGLTSGEILPFEDIVERLRRGIADIGEICVDCTSAGPDGFAAYRSGLAHGL